MPTLRFKARFLGKLDFVRSKKRKKQSILDTDYTEKKPATSTNDSNHDLLLESVRTKSAGWGASVTPRRGASHLISGAIARRKVAAMMKGHGLSRRKGHKLRREGRREGTDEEKGHCNEEGAQTEEEGT